MIDGWPVSRSDPDHKVIFQVDIDRCFHCGRETMNNEKRPQIHETLKWKNECCKGLNAIYFFECNNYHQEAV